MRHRVVVQADERMARAVRRQRGVEAPELVNEEPYGRGWLARIRMSDPSEADALLDVGAYRAHVAEQ